MNQLRIKINGRALPKERTLSKVLSEANDALDKGSTFHVLKDGRWVAATSIGQFGVVHFDDGSLLDGLDNELRMNPTWRESLRD
jgi:hypothetical protein